VRERHAARSSHGGGGRTGAQAKHREERGIVKAFLQHKGWPVLSWSSRTEKPDVRLRASVENRDLRIGVEVTEYAPSPGTRQTVGAWDAIQEEVRRQASCCPELAHVCATIHLQGNSTPRKVGYFCFAEQITRFLLAQARAGPLPSKAVAHTAFGKQYPLLSKYVQAAHIWTGPSHKDQIQLGNRAGSFGGPMWEPVVGTLRTKTKRLKDYDLSHLDEVWLLIYSVAPPGRARSMEDVMGHRPPSRPPDEVAESARASGFDRVFIYSDVFHWDKELWPAKATAAR
jgi:hypothetical protein